MQKTRKGNPNHPAKDSVIRVQPITRRSDRECIEGNLAGQPRNRSMFITGTNTKIEEDRDERFKDKANVSGGFFARAGRTKSGRGGSRTGAAGFRGPSADF